MAGEPWCLALVDGFRLRRGGTEVRLAPGSQRLVAWLALRPPATREQLAGLLAPEDDEGHALGVVRTALWRVQRSAPELVSAAPGLVGLGRARVDVRDLVTAARALLASPGEAPVEVLTQRWDGELLPGWYDDWALAERERLRQLQLHVLEAAGEELRRRGRFAEALEAAWVAAQIEPLRESSHALAVRVHLAEGNAVEALRAYERFALLLRRELGIAPSARLAALVRPVQASARMVPAQGAHTPAAAPREGDRR